MLSKKKKILVIVAVLLSFLLLLIFTLNITTNNKNIQQPKSVGDSDSQQNTPVNSHYQAIEASVAKEKIELKALQEELDLEIDLPSIMDMQWDAKEISCELSDREKLATTVELIPVKNAGSTPECISVLRESLTEMIFDYGKNDFDAYFNFLRMSGETLADDIYKYFWDELQQSNISKEKLTPDMDMWELLSLRCEDERYNARWKGFVLEGSEINLFKTQTHEVGTKPGQLSQPGDLFWGLRVSRTNFRHITNPPISLPDALKSNGNVLMADVTLFIAHTDEIDGIIRPYVSRYWFDSQNNLWRPVIMSFFPNHKEIDEMDEVVDFLF